MDQQPTYPLNPQEWQKVIQEGIGFSKSEGIKKYQANCFPFEELEKWIMKTYNEGYSPNFIPALLRNIKGLVAWVYGNGDEPNWTKTDETQ